MADDRSKSDSNKLSPLERYLAKQKADKQAAAAKEAPTPKSRLAKIAEKKEVTTREAATAKPSATPKTGPKAAVSYGANERPQLGAVERPEPLQPPSLSRWESVAENRLHEDEVRAREAGAPVAPPSFTDPIGAPAASRSAPPPPSAPAPAPVAEDRYQPLTDRELHPDGLINADFGPRFIAYLIDLVILTVIGSVAVRAALAVLALAFGSAAEAHRDGLTDLIYLGLLYAYYGYFYPTKGASPGKLLLNLEVADVDGRTRLSPWKAFFREAIGKPISFIPFCMGFVIILIRLDHRALHDLLFDTRVIRKQGPLA